MGACLSKKKDSSTSSPLAGPKSVSTAPSQLKNSGNGVTATLSKPTHPEMTLKKEKQDQLPQEDEGQVKKEIFIIKHRKSHDDNRERNSKTPPFTAQQNVPPQQTDGLASAPTNEPAESMGNHKVAPSTPDMGVVGVRTSSCTKEEVDAILIQCGRLSRSSSGRAASSSAASGGRKYSGSKRSFDFDHCDNDAISADDDQKRANAAATNNNNDLLCEEYDGVGVASEKHQHRQRHRQSPRSSSSQGRRRTPSRERDQQQQRSSSRERRVSRSPGKRSSETNATTANVSNNTSSRPGKMVSVPATVSSLVMDKSNNGVGVGESVPASGIKKITVKRNIGDGGVVGPRSAASPRSKSPARANGNAVNAKVLSENQQQQQPSLSRNNSSRKAEQSPYRRNPLSEIDQNSLAYPQSNTNNKLQNKPKKETEAEANQKPNVDVHENSKNRISSRVALEKGVSVNCKTKEQQEEDIKVLSSVTDNVVVKTVVASGVDNLRQPQTLTRSRSSRRSRDLDLNPEAPLNPTQSYTSLLLEDIQNFHQKNTQQQPSISLPACLTKACSILEAVADLNSTTSSNFCDDRRSPPTYQSVRNNEHYGKRVTDSKDHPFVESEVVVSDDVMEPSLHKYVTVKRGGSVGGVDMEDQESSGSNSFSVVSNGQQHWSNISSSWEPNSADSTDCWTSRLSSGEELGQKTLNSKRRECDHQHSSGIGRGRLGSSDKGLHTLPVVTAAAST